MKKNHKNMNVVFMGTSSFASDILAGLIENNFDILSVYTQPDKKNGRENKLEKSAVKLLVEKKQLPIFQPEKFDETAINQLKVQKPDIIIVAAFGKILPVSALDLPKFGCLNVHASLLPKWRGPSPVQNAILNGDLETGVTIMLMDKGIDTGDILAQEKVIIDGDIKYPDLLGKMAKLSGKLLLKTIPLWTDEKINSKKQNNDEVTYCRMIKRNDGKINWNSDALSLYNQWRAFFPWPGIFAYWNKDGYNLRIKLKKISLAKNFEENGKKPGEVFMFENEISVKASDGAIILHKIQLESKAETNANDFVNGHPKFIGSVLE